MVDDRRRLAGLRAKHRLKPRTGLLALLLVGVASTVTWPNVRAAATTTTCAEARGWPAADRLFRGDRRWLGADGAFSVDLGGGRVLWLFGDSWVDAAGSGSRGNAVMLRNTIAIQQGYDPADATIRFHWRAPAAGEARAFFTPAWDDDAWYWPGHGIRLGERLLIFLNRLRPADDDFGFASAGWAIVSITNVDAEPGDWRIESIDAPDDPDGITPGFASVLRHEDYVYAFGTPDAEKSHPLMAARWPVAALERGELSAMQWWGGAAGWVADPEAHARVPLFDHGQSEMSVHFDASHGQFVAVQSVGFGAADVGIRQADTLTDTWTSPQRVYSPPEKAKPNATIYAAKAHPELEGADLVLTYATNSFRFMDHLEDADTYYPHFVRLTHCEDRR